MGRRVHSRSNPGRRGLKLLAILSTPLLTALSLHGSQIAQVALPDFYQLEVLQAAGFDVSYYSPGGLAEVILMNQDDRDRLNRTGLTYFISVENLEELNRSRLVPGRDDMGGYRTLDEIVEEMNRLHEDFPEVVSEPMEIGRSIEDRPIWAIRVSDNPDDDEDEPEALFTSLIHCREVVTSYVLFAVIEQLARGYGEDERLTMLVEERQSWFIPVVNPDGYYFNEENSPNGGGMWRKNRRRNEGGTIGVDLNRNFGAHWGYDNVGSSPNGNTETYRGTEAFSEPETQTIRDFVNGRRFAASIFFHSYSNLCLYPYGYDVLQPPDRSVFAALSRKMIVSSRYLPGTGWEVIYRTNGDSDDWLYSDDDHDPIFAFTVEVGSRQDHFWPPLNRVEPLVAENIETVLTLIEYADSPQRVLAPPIPGMTRATITPNGRLSLLWSEQDDEHNPAVFFNVKAILPGQPVVDNGPADDQNWVKVNFNMSQNDPHSGSHSYRAALQAPMSTMTLAEPIIIPDTVRAWMSYTLRSNRAHCIALEASLDGHSWEPLPGNRTQDLVVNQRNIGPGIYGISGGWVNTWWTTGDYIGKVAKLRFRYYSFDNWPNPVNSEFCYIDDISPMPVTARLDVLAEGIEGTSWDGRLQEHERELLYVVEAIDSDGEHSFFSTPIPAEEGDDGLVLRCEAGWSLISAPFEAPDPSPAAIFAPWIERETLMMIKDGWGNFFLPAMDFDQIGEWNPTAGYQVKLNNPDTLEFPGERLPADTPVPLAQGWSAIGYMPAVAMFASVALESVVSNVIFVKNGFGEFWAVDQNFSNLRALDPGTGLKIKMSDPDTLIYTEPENFAVSGRAGFPYGLPGFVPETPFNMSLIVDLPEGHGDGSIRLYDRDGYLSGGCVIDADAMRVGVAVWGEEQAGRAGFGEGETLRMFWRSAAGVETRLDPECILGKPVYETDALAILRSEFNHLPVGIELDLSSSPNPFNGRTLITLGFADAERISLEIRDVAGRLIQDFHPESKPAGSLTWVWNGSSQPAGIYFVKATVQSGGSVRSAFLKLALVK